jgi:hypothetical protein
MWPSPSACGCVCACVRGRTRACAWGSLKLGGWPHKRVLADEDGRLQDDGSGAPSLSFLKFDGRNSLGGR